MRASFHTLGCKVNQYETTVMAGMFLDDGFEVVPGGFPADVCVVNSCTVTAEGDRKTRRLLRRLRSQNPGAVICLTGCLPQAFPDTAQILPEADIIMGTANRAGLLVNLRQFLLSRERIVDIAPHGENRGFEPMRISGQGARGASGRTRAVLKIEDGCGHGCAFCIVPKARGPVRSKPLQDIQKEAAGLAGAGYREIVLTGINLACYGMDLDAGLADAVKLCCDIPGVERVRLGSLEPDLITAEVIDSLAPMKKLCPQFHLSLQSGCDKTLAQMRRRYTSHAYSGVAENLRAAFHGCSITTDIMAGFPGETDDDHRASLDFAVGIGFAKAHVFAYSPRPGTIAADLPGQIPHEIKTARAKELAHTMEITRKSFLQKQVGTCAPVLLEHEKGGKWHGFTPNYTPVVFVCPRGVSGEIRDVQITGTGDDNCVGYAGI